jgi:hypothetical protein
MKTKHWFLILLLVLPVACRKENRLAQSVTPENLRNPALKLQDVQKWYTTRSFLQTSAAASAFKLSRLTPEWTKAESFATTKRNYWLINLPGQPVVHQVKQGFRKIAFMADSLGQIRARILEIVPDARYWLRQGKASTGDFTGYVYIYDEDYHFLGGKIYASGKQVGESRPVKTGSVDATKLKTNDVYVSEDCEWYDSSYTDSEGNLVIHSDRLCKYTVYEAGFYPDISNSGSTTGGDALSGSGSNSPALTAAAVAELPGEKDPAIKPVDFIKCFDTLPDDGSSMQVTVYVQEPQPGTAFPLGVNGVGHTAVGLSKTYAGNTINQVMGFYPQDHLQIFNGPGKLVDNSNMAFNSSITYTVNASQFNQIAAYLANPPANYSLYELNCTNFAINALQQGGITLPNANTIVGLNGVGGLGYAMTPGGLGDSLDSLKGQSNVNNSGGTMPRSHGACN